MIILNINNRDYEVDAERNELLVWVIREKIGLTETKFGCGRKTCGACTIFVDGTLVHSCVTDVSTVLGKKITTREGLQNQTF